MLLLNKFDDIQAYKEIDSEFINKMDKRLFNYFKGPDILKEST